MIVIFHPSLLFVHKYIWSFVDGSYKIQGNELLEIILI